MQKLLLIIAVLMVIPAAMTAQTAKTRQGKGAPFKLSTSTLKGDVNGDGDVNVTDVTLIVSYIMGQQNDNFIIANADVNGDGDITISDVTANVIIVIYGSGVTIRCPDENHPHMIDLGLPSGTKWACCNVGSDKPEEYGGYYAWGETQEKDYYDWYTYQYWIDINGDGDWGFNELTNLGSDIAGTQYDVAHVQWGGSWVMPSLAQIQELINNCSITWTTWFDIYGGKFTGPNGGIIFLPAAGSKYREYVGGCYGNYWSSTQNPSDLVYAYYLDFAGWGYASWYGSQRYEGMSVRPVSR